MITNAKFSLAVKSGMLRVRFSLFFVCLESESEEESSEGEGMETVSEEDEDEAEDEGSKPVKGSGGFAYPEYQPRR